jgi:hypothetical protein
MLSLSLGLTGGGMHALFTGHKVINISPDVQVDPDFVRLIAEEPWIPDAVNFMNSTGGHITLIAVGVLLIFFTLHIAKGIGYVHGRIAETLLVRL